MNMFTRVMPVVLAVLLPGALPGQTNVDRLVAQLESVSKGTLDNWKYSTDFSTDPTKPGFDDSQWATLPIGRELYIDSCWMRKEVTLPERMLGQPTSGALRFLVSVDDYGFLFVNGESRGYFPWDGEFELTKSARGGEKFLLAIKAINTGGPLRLLRAQIVPGGDHPLARTVDDFTLGVKVAQKLLSSDTYQTNARVRVDPGTDRSHMDRQEKSKLYALLQETASKVDTGALVSGSVDRFRMSLSAARTALAPVAAFVHRFTVYLDANAHIDAAWLWRSKETIAVCRNTFSSVMNLMAARPDFTYTQSSAAYYDWIERLSPDLFTQIRQRVKDGRWEVVGGMWVEPDCNLPSGESWARHLMYAKKYFREKLGTDVKIGWNPDSFGYNLNMPAFYRNAGIDAFITQKIGWNETNVFPYRTFWWESPDGSRILSYFPFDYVNTIDNPYQLADWLRQFEANTGFTKMLILFGVGDHGGGPSLEMLDRIDRLKSLDLFPRIEYGTAGKYIEWLRSNDLSDLPVWKDELYLEYHQGTFTTQAAMKQFNRSNETLLTNAEKLSSFASLTGSPYAAASLEEAWHDVMFNQFHDILPGSGIREVYIDAAATHRDAQVIGRHELTRSLDFIASGANTSAFSHGTPFIVFNTLSWERTDVAAVDLRTGDEGSWRVFDAHGREVPSQTVRSSRYERRVIFIAAHVPPLGYSTYELRKAASPPSPAPAALPFAPENRLFRVAIDSVSGWIRSITDKRSGRELLAGEGNRIQLLEDLPRQWDAWNIGLTGREFPSTFRGAEVVEQGPVRWVVRLTRDYLKPGVRKDFPTEDFPSSFFTQDVILYDGLDRIDFTTDADWWEDHTMAKLAFPLAFSDTAATYEAPYGTIRRSTMMRTSVEKAQVEVPAARWADVSTDEYGVSLINGAKYGYDIKGNTMRLSLLRSPRWPDPTADRGKHSISYSLYPHPGRWQSAATHQRGYEFNTPLLAAMTDPHKGKLPAAHSFLSITPSNLVLTSVKRAEEGNAWVLQWYDVKGEPSRALVTLPFHPSRALVSNFMEEEGAPIEVKGNTIAVPTTAHGIVTVKVYL
ncbi:MAG TPA: glycoside hydrolase family 38 C-terminal domain-containing protein [Bacteroidota bacterium]|nr:glycoside hydrolase family 38 C-terminal domain-containing protein [Bacteroidota bacterium]